MKYELLWTRSLKLIIQSITWNCQHCGLQKTLHMTKTINHSYCKCNLVSSTRKIFFLLGTDSCIQNNVSYLSGQITDYPVEIHLSVCLSVYLCMSVNLSVCLSAYIQYMYLMYIWDSGYLSVSLSVYSTLQICFTLNVYMSLCLCQHYLYIEKTRFSARKESAFGRTVHVYKPIHPPIQYSTTKIVTLKCFQILIIGWGIMKKINLILDTRPHELHT